MAGVEIRGGGSQSEQLPSQGNGETPKRSNRIGCDIFS